MSTIKGTEINGDVVVGRNVTAGGSAVVRGSVTVKKNMRVEGWLDANNVRVASKGLFVTEASLKETYPKPETGWWALVGNTLPAPIYVEQDGQWVATGTTGGALTVDDVAFRDEIEQDIAQANSRIDGVGEEVAAVSNSVTLINNKVGKIGGICPLGKNGIVPAKYLPSNTNSVSEFNAIVDNVSIKDTEIQKSSFDNGCMVVYDKSVNKFLLAVAKEDASNLIGWNNVRRPAVIRSVSRQTFDPTIQRPIGSITDVSVPSDLMGQYWSDMSGGLRLEASKFDYYPVWSDANTFGSESDFGCIPVADKIYTSSSDNKTFKWNGASLIAIGSDLKLGYESGNAFPGEEGEMLSVRMDEVEVSVGSLESKSATDHSYIVALQGEVDNLSSRKADVSEVEQIKANVTTAINSSNAAIQSVCAAFTCATEAKTASTAAVERVDALEARTSFEEIASEEEWEARKNAGTLDADKLYFIAEV